MAILNQDGQTAEEWLSHIFEYELCSECGYDADKHTVVINALGLFFARCDDPIPENLSDEEIDAEFQRRCKSNTEG